MRAITVQQPWAWALIHGGKTVENRTQYGMWRRLAGETVAIHAGRRWSTRGARLVPDLAGRPWQQGWHDPVDRVPAGVIIGVVDVEDVHPEQGGCCPPWGEASYVKADGRRRVDVVHIVTVNPVALAVPVPVRGKLGAWHLPPLVEAAVRSDLASTGVSA